MNPVASNVLIHAGKIRYDWTQGQVMELYHFPCNDLILQAASTHQQNFNPIKVQVGTLLSIKAGPCPLYCSNDNGCFAIHYCYLRDILIANKSYKYLSVCW